VGSLKKVARRILPFTAQSNSAHTGEDVKELQAILNDDSLSNKERHYVRDAMKRFQRQDNRGLVEKADVVGKKFYAVVIKELSCCGRKSDTNFRSLLSWLLGATCVASMFEVMDDASFPIVILDEARYVCDIGGYLLIS